MDALRSWLDAPSGATGAFAPAQTAALTPDSPVFWAVKAVSQVGIPGAPALPEVGSAAVGAVMIAAEMHDAPAFAKPSMPEVPKLSPQAFVASLNLPKPLAWPADLVTSAMDAPTVSAPAIPEPDLAMLLPDEAPEEKVESMKRLEPFIQLALDALV